MAKPPPPIYAPIRLYDDTKVGAIDTMTVQSDGDRVMLEVSGDLYDPNEGDVRWSARVPLPAGWSLVRTEDTDG